MGVFVPVMVDYNKRPIKKEPNYRNPFKDIEISLRRFVGFWSKSKYLAKYSSISTMDV